MKLPHVDRLLVTLKKTLPAVLLLCALSLCLAPEARAQLVLNIDTGNETVWLTGSDTGSVSSGFVKWTSGGSGYVEDLSMPSSLTSNSLTFLVQPSIFFYGDGILLQMEFSSSGSTTLTGTSTSASYATMTSGSKTILESVSSLSLNLGSGFQSIAVNVTAVPEPSTYAAIFGVIVLLGTIAVRKRAKRD